MSYTKGPWKVDFQLDGGFRVTGKGGNFGQDYYVICSRKRHERKEETHANARLIAAAPELLEALRGLHDDIAEYQRLNNLGGYDNHWMRLARAAIEKATKP